MQVFIFYRLQFVKIKNFQDKIKEKLVHKKEFRRIDKNKRTSGSVRGQQFLSSPQNNYNSRKKKNCQKPPFQGSGNKPKRNNLERGL